MDRVSRRDFVGLVGGAAAYGFAAPMAEGAAPRGARARSADGMVRLTGDGVGLATDEYTSLLDELCRNAPIRPDSYLLGGEVERFEEYCAEVLGKETAVFMPSGTLANQLAIRALAGDRRRVIVPETSHVYNDTGDACQILSGLNLIPLAPGAATFAVADVEQVIRQTAGGRVAAQVGAILVESPVRRLSGELFDWEEMQRLSAFARERGIALHLDGARLFIASAYTGIQPAEYAALFDTVYVSLWKCFNSGVGAILAGPRAVLGDMYHTRRMFGGNLWEGWPAALIARHYMEGYGERLRAAVRVSEEFYETIGARTGFSVERVPRGSNIARVRVEGSDLEGFRRRLEELGILLPEPGDWGGFSLTVNETWARTSGAELADAFAGASA